MPSPSRTADKAMLEALERANLFVVPLDDRRRWYRYHHLFGDVLRAHLAGRAAPGCRQRCTAGERVVRANGEQPEAIRHALAAGDFGRAADLVELAWPGCAEPARGHAAGLAQGAARRAAPQPARAQQCLCRGRCCPSGELDERRRPSAGRRTVAGYDRQRAERGLPSAGMVVVDEEEFRRLPGSIALHRAGLALAQGDVAETVQLRPAGARPRA